MSSAAARPPQPVADAGPAWALAAFEAAPVALVRIDAQGQVRRANARARALLGPGLASPGTPLLKALGADPSTGALSLPGAEPQVLSLDWQGQTLRLQVSALPDGERLWHIEANAHGAAEAPGERLQALSSQLALAEDLMGLGLWWHDLRTDRVHCNPQASRLVGLPERPAGVTLDDVRARIHPDDWRVAEVSARDAVQGGRAGDLVVRCDDGRGGWRLLLMRRALQHDGRGKPHTLHGVVLDVTESRRTQDEARLASERFELATRTAGIGYWARAHDRDRAFWNAQMYALHALPANAPVPTLKEWLQTYPVPEDRPRIGGRFRAWLSGGTDHLDGEIRIVDRQGRLRYLRIHAHQEPPGADGAPGVQFGIAIDITERRSADLALRSAEQRALLAARGAGLGTWDLDLLTGRTQWDDQMWRLRGVEPRPEPPAREVSLQFVHPDDRGRVDSRFLDVYRGTDISSHRFRVVWPDGSVRWLASRSAPVHDSQGRIVRRIGVNWDVTVEREAEIERRERAAAERASQAKSEFLARMSHELRTPLNAVLGFAQLLLLPGADTDPERRREQLGHILAAGQHLLQLINDVLDLSRVDSGHLRVEPRPVALAPLVGELFVLLDGQRASMDVTLAVEGGDAWLLADPTRLRQVLLNLIGNAIKYNRRGGRVTVTARPSGERVRVEVADTGRGMTPAQLEQLFQPFNRLGAESSGIEGAGIGLALVKALVGHMGGTIEVRSQPDVGSRFTVDLPAADPADGRADGRADAPAGGIAPVARQPSPPQPR